MSVLVRIGRRKAILCGGKWTSADPGLEQRLQHSLDIWIHKTGGPPLNAGDPDRYAAEAMKQEMKYSILIAARPRGHAARHAYLEKRQYRLPF